MSIFDENDKSIDATLERIHEITSRNLRRVGGDIWGAFKEAKDSVNGLNGQAPSVSYRDEELEKQIAIIEQMTKDGAKSISDSLWNDVKPETVKKAKEEPAPAAEKKEEEQTEEEPEKLEDILSELNGYIGLDKVKTEVENLVNLVKVQKMRKEHDLPTPKMSLHMVFTGNPGTGKTMIARVMARIYKCLGILSKGQLIEVDRGGLVAGYVGQTATKTQEVIDKALGGVLFIDEAYALTYHKEGNDFGQEAVDTLLKAMEDHRDDLIVIVAGYNGLMEEFIHSNPGLESRFNRFIHFDDYTLEEMMAIFNMRCDQGGYKLSENATDEVETFIKKQNVDPITFGNARGVRNLFEQVLVAQCNRVVNLTEVTREALMEITEEDVNAAIAASVDKEKREEETSLEDLLVSLKDSVQPKDDESASES